MTPPEQPESGDPTREPTESDTSDIDPRAEHRSDAGAGDDTSRDESSAPPDDVPTDAASHSAFSVDASEAPAEQADAQESTGDQAAQPNGQETAAPKRKRTGLLVGVAAGLVVIASGGAALFFALGGGASAQSVAEEYVALSDREAHNPGNVTVEDYRPLVCDQAMPQIEQLQQAKQKFLQNATPQQLEQLKKVKTNVTDVQENGNTAQATFESTTPGGPPETSKLNLVKEDGSWKFCTS